MSLTIKKTVICCPKCGSNDVISGTISGYPVVLCNDCDKGTYLCPKCKIPLVPEIKNGKGHMTCPNCNKKI